MTEYYYRTTFDDYKNGLEDFSLTNPPTQIEAKHSVFQHFCEDTKAMYEDGKVVLAVTVTISPTTKYNGRLIWNASPQRQYEALRFMINSAMRKYHKKYNVGVKAYFFFEATQAGKIHAHGVFSQLNNDSYYPIYLSQLKTCLLKVGFRSFGTKVEYIKYWNEWTGYCAKDHGKHKLTPLYIFI